MTKKDENRILNLINEYKKLSKELEESYKRRLSIVEDLHAQILNILGLEEWDEKEILEKVNTVTNDEKIKIHELWMAADTLNRSLLKEAFDNYNSDVNLENAFIESFSKQKFNNLSNEDEAIIQDMYKKILESQKRQLDNYPIFEQIKEEYIDKKEADE